MNDDIKIRIGGNTYDRWKRISFENSIGAIASIINMSFMEKYRSRDSIIWQIGLGARTQLKVNDNLIFDGYIEGIEETRDNETHELRMIAREITGDLVDCAHINYPREWFSVDLLTVAKEVCAPFGITVYGGSSAIEEYGWSFLFPHIKYNEGETIVSMLSRYAQIRGLILIYTYDNDKNSPTYNDAALFLTNAGDERLDDAIITGISTNQKGSAYWRSIGHNVKSSTIRTANKDRFSKIICKTQSAGTSFRLNATTTSGADTLESFTQAYGEALDSAVTRYRPTVVLSPVGGNFIQMQDLAKWEAMNRAGLSSVAEYVVQGWSMRNGRPWPINARVPVKDEYSGIDGDMLINSVIMTSDRETGTTTRITVVDPRTYKGPAIASVTESGEITPHFNIDQ